MIMPRSKKMYFCVPIGLALPLIFLALTILQVAMAAWLSDIGQYDVVPIFYVFAILSLLIAVCTIPKVAWRVEILSSSIVCKCVLPHSAFALEYENCTVGMD